MVLDKNSILKADDRRSQELDVPEWGGKVKIKEPSMAGIEAFLKAQAQGEPAKAMTELVAAGLVDDKGECMFTTDADKELLAGKGFMALKRIFDAVNDIREEVPEQEELIKNSQEIDPNDSFSD